MSSQLNKRVVTWATAYMGGMGFSQKVIDEQLKMRPEFWSDCYEKQFNQPIEQMLPTNDPDLNNMKNRFLTIAVKSSCKDWMFLLPFWSKYKDFYAYSGDLRKDLQDCFERTNLKSEKRVATFGSQCTDVEIRMIGAQTISTYVMPYLVYEPEFGAQANGHTLRGMIQRKDIYSVTDAELRFIEEARKNDMIGFGEFATIKVPNCNGELTVYDCTSEDKPPKSYYMAWKTAADAYKQSFDAFVRYCGTLNDPEVSEYLKDYEIPSAPPTAFTYLPEGYENKTVEELLKAVEDDPNYTAGTLDELILQYCNAWNVDTRCTIAQLLEHINTEDMDEITPIESSSELEKRLKATLTKCPSTTLLEFMADQEHSAASISREDVVGWLKTNLRVPESFIDTMLTASFIEEVRKPKVKETTSQDVTKYLTSKANLTKEQCTALLTTKELPKHETTDDEVIAFLKSRTDLSETAIRELLNNDTRGITEEYLRRNEKYIIEQVMKSYDTSAVSAPVAETPTTEVVSEEHKSEDPMEKATEFIVHEVRKRRAGKTPLERTAYNCFVPILQRLMCADAGVDEDFTQGFFDRAAKVKTNTEESLKLLEEVHKIVFNE